MTGLLGGTFDPIHNAHLTMARVAAAQCGLTQVLLIPASDPPHRARGTYAGYEDRFRMVEIACAGQSLLAPSRLEQGPGKSYSIDTVERLRAQQTAPEPLFFIIGADAFADIQTWRRWQDLSQLVTFAVVGRPGADYAAPPGVRLRRVDGVDLPVSSSEIRAKLKQGDKLVDLPPGVLAYIQKHGLYGQA